jgi:hypothetical protein
VYGPTDPRLLDASDLVDRLYDNIKGDVALTRRNRQDAWVKKLPTDLYQCGLSPFAESGHNNSNQPRRSGSLRTDHTPPCNCAHQVEVERAAADYGGRIRRTDAIQELCGGRKQVLLVLSWRVLSLQTRTTYLIEWLLYCIAVVTWVILGMGP